jgi:hypothetical protein
MEWPFDQEKNTAAITTRQVMKEGYPILSVVHYSDDHSWAFTCGSTNNPQDAMVVCMEEVVSMDSSLFSVADLPPGWCAQRKSVNAEWVRYKDESI